MTDSQIQNNDETQIYIHDLCEVLRIGRLELHIRETVLDKRMRLRRQSDSPYVTHILYDSSDYAFDTQISEHFQNSGGGACLYIAFPLNNRSPWTDIETARIKLLLRLIFTFNSKNKLLSVIGRLAYFDQELNVHNLTFFFRHLNVLHDSQALVGQTAVWFNLKRFSAVNEQLGRQRGSEVLQRFTGQINTMLEGRGVLSRLGGDNFVMIMPASYTERILNALAGMDVVYDDCFGEKVLISAYVGAYTVLPYSGNEYVSEIMDRITIAGHIARESSSADLVWFDEQMLRMKSYHMKILNLFPQAMENNDLVVHYQPKVSLSDYRIAGAEALCRWRHQDKLMPPADFIPVLEKGMEICQLDFYILDKVCADIRRWLDSGRDVVRISVNLSRRHMADMDLLKHITEIVDRHNVPHGYIEIELTETTTDVEFRDLKRIVSGLQQAGFMTSVDDFGVGYSSMTLIKDIPWDVLKVDKSFLPIEDQKDNPQKRVMFKYLLAMAREMGIECVAEGVETKEQLDLLLENSCDLVQGFLFDHPLSAEEFEKRLISTEYLDIVKHLAIK